MPLHAFAEVGLVALDYSVNLGRTVKLRTATASLASAPCSVLVSITFLQVLLFLLAALAQVASLLTVLTRCQWQSKQQPSSGLFSNVPCMTSLHDTAYTSSHVCRPYTVSHTLLIHTACLSSDRIYYHAITRLCVFMHHGLANSATNTLSMVMCAS